jgi:hypothetical protein
MPNLKIISDGNPENTKVIDVKTGQKINGIRSLKWTIDYANLGHCKVEIEFDAVGVAIESSNAEFYLNKADKELIREWRKHHRRNKNEKS